MDAATFRADLPEFASTVTYPDAQVNFYLGLGQKLLPADRWDDLLDYGLELFVAHNLVLSAQNVRAATSGGMPGVSIGVTSGKTVDKVSVTYDTQAAMLPDAGHWALTTYGIRFLQLARMVGAGGIQL